MPLNLSSIRQARNVVFQQGSAPQTVIGQQLIYWPGRPAPSPYVWAPKVRSWATLTNLGWDEADQRALYLRADSRRTTTAAQLRAVNAQVQFNGSADNLAIPGVYVPTSLANGYGGYLG